jgi:polysaccharide pyruvyl transferase WcaK-like protein
VSEDSETAPPSVTRYRLAFTPAGGYYIFIKPAFEVMARVRTSPCAYAGRLKATSAYGLARGFKRLRILVENSGYDLDNLGDICMLQVSFQRLRANFPGAEIAIVTRDSQRLRLYCEGSRPVLAEQNRAWRHARSLYLRLRRGLPSLDPLVRVRTPGLYDRLQRFRARHSVGTSAVRRADLMVASGGGFITDVFRGQTWSVLERLQAAVKEGAAVALFGQGIGPLRDPVLLEKAREVLPSAVLIGLRERLTSLPILESLGVPSDRIVVTGDDAVEPAYASRGDVSGEYLGVNLRVAGHANVGREMTETVREPLMHIARRLKSRMIALPISLSGVVESASDAAVSESLIAGPRASDEAHGEPGEPRAIIKRIGRCRVVVTGSYHAAVFALAQGIPAVCLFNSEYYEAKFRGLADLFGVGVEVLSLSGRHFREPLIEKTLAAWEQADALRPRLLLSAEWQVRAGRMAYERLRELVESGR